MNILCLVESLEVEHNNLYLKLKQLLGDSLKKDLTVRKVSIHSEDINITFANINWHTQQIGGMLIDIAIIDCEPTEEWEEFLKYKVLANNGLMLRVI